MDILLNKEQDLYVGALGFQSSIFLMQLQAKLQEAGLPFETKPESEFEDMMDKDVQLMIIKDEDLVKGVLTMKYTKESGNGEATFPKHDVDVFFGASEYVGKIMIFTEEDDE